MKAAVVFDMMIYGGIERIGISYVQLIRKMGYEVTAYILNPDTEDIVEELRSICEVKILNFKKTKCPEAYWGMAVKYTGGKWAFPFFYLFTKLMTPIWKLLIDDKEKYDLAIAFSGHYNDLTFVGEHYIKSDYQLAWVHGAQYSYGLISPGFFKLYTKIRNLVCLSELCDAECFLFNQQNRIRKWKVYNPICIQKTGINKEKVQELKRLYGEFCLMVARLSPDKDQLTAIRAIHYIKETYGIDKNLVLVGDGIRREELEEYVKEKGIEKNVHFEGLCSDVQNYYSAATIYVHSSPLEGLPTVLLEAMSFGLPISATDSIPGVREILGNDQYGLVSPVGDEIALAENILSLYEDEILRTSLVNKGKERIKDFSFEEVQKQLEQVFEEMRGITI